MPVCLWSQRGVGFGARLFKDGARPRGQACHHGQWGPHSAVPLGIAEIDNEHEGEHEGEHPGVHEERVASGMGDRQQEERGSQSLWGFFGPGVSAHEDH